MTHVLLLLILFVGIASCNELGKIHDHIHEHTPTSHNIHPHNHGLREHRSSGTRAGNADSPGTK